MKAVWQLEGQTWEQVWTQSWLRIWELVGDKTGERIWCQVNTDVWNRVVGQVQNPVRSLLGRSQIGRPI